MAILPQLEPKERSEERQATLYSSIFQVAKGITEICYTHNKEPQEVVNTYCQAYELLVEQWFKATPLKGQVRNMLEMLFPDYYNDYPDDSPYKKKY